MTSITKSDAYELDLHAKRLFKNLGEDIQTFEKHVDEIRVVTNLMRSASSRAMLGIAQLEALYVDQTENKRKVDEELVELQRKLHAIVEKATTKIIITSEAVRKESDKIESIKVQAERAAHDRFAPPTNDMTEGVEYVDSDYICEALNCTVRSLTRYITDGRISEHCTLDTENNRTKPKRLWLKSMMDQEIAEFRGEKAEKRAGILTTV